MSKYLVSTDGYLESLISNENTVFFYVESDNDIRKAIESYAAQYDYIINWESLEIDYALERIKFFYDFTFLFDDTTYDFCAEWTLIEITKP